MLNRRAFFKTSGLALVSGAFLPRVFTRIAQGATTAGRRTMVVIFQRGAVDGLNVVVPVGERTYYDARPNISIPAPGRDGGAINLDGFFGLHPSLAPLKSMFADRSLAVVHACGSPDPSRSHFDAQDFMESGTPGVKSTEDGFLSRALIASQERKPSPLRAVAFSPSLPRMLSGSCGAVAMTNVSSFGVAGAENSGSFEEMYSGAVAGALGGTAKESFEASKILKAADPERQAPSNGAAYPQGPFGNALRQIAQLIKSDIGLEVAFADVGGWDTHAGEGGAQGQLGNRLGNYAQALTAFVRDMGSRMGDVTLVTCSEFGRTVKENGNRGTDHGHANAMFLLGGGVRGGKVYGQWPGLDSSHLYENRDLAVTTDFRDVFGEVLSKRLGVSNLNPVFPGYSNDSTNWRGVVG